jgi:hypothetical protein
MDVKELPTDLLNKNTEPGSVWLYVNPLTGKHCKTTGTNKLAAFKTRESAMSWEPDSRTLQKNICYEVSWDEMISIANKEAGGVYVIL